MDIFYFNYFNNSSHNRNNTILRSHGLTFTTAIILLSFSKIFCILQKEKLNNKDSIFFFFLIPIVSIGKISSGFALALFIGFYLLFKHKTDIKIYLLGINWVLFFYLYKLALKTERGSIPFENTDLFDSEFLVNFLSVKHRIISLIFILSCIFILHKIKRSTHLTLGLYSSVISIIITICLLIVSKNFTPSDMGYLLYGTYFTCLLYLISTIFKIENSFMKNRYITLFFIILTMYGAVIFLPNSSLNLKTISFINVQTKTKELNTMPFSCINQNLRQIDKISITKIITHDLNLKSFLELNHLPIATFRESLDKYMNDKKINKSKTRLYIPKEIYESDFHILRSMPKWSYGFLSYAITGIPNLYGVRKIAPMYGLSRYSSKHRWLPKEKFDPGKVCKKKLMIIIVESFSPPRFLMHQCDK